jgi:UDP-N-acetylmuramate--alanine ligase
MSALARYFNSTGKVVFGYDKTPGPITDSLQNEGIEIRFKDDYDWVKSRLEQYNREDVLIIFTPAIPGDLSIKQGLEADGYEPIKRSQALGIITGSTVNLSVAGTHGKTTTSSLLAHLLADANIPHVAFLGGIASNFDSNYHNSLTSLDEAISVTEADEFDRSFLRLHPAYAVITSMDADHLDIYGNPEELVNSFKDFAKQVTGELFVQDGLKQHFSSAEITTYGIDCGEVQGQNVHVNQGRYVFDFWWNDIHLKDLELGMAGLHNVENAIGASAVALKNGVSPAQLRSGLASFKGVKRRFEFKLNSDVVYIDDYAHHPTELEATIKSARQLFPEKRITGIFQPHLYSRTQDFAEGFAESLSLLDEVVLMDIYPARELPIPGVTSEIIFDRISTEKKLLNGEAIFDHLKENRPEVLLTLGAGDIDRIVEPIKSLLS